MPPKNNGRRGGLRAPPSSDEGSNMTDVSTTAAMNGSTAGFHSGPIDGFMADAGAETLQICNLVDMVKEEPIPVGLHYDLETTHVSSKRKKSDPLNMTREQEEEVADWYLKNQILYNRKRADYKQIDRKARIMEEKAVEIGCTAQQLKTWIDSMRTTVGKLTDPTKKQSEDRILTDRENWILENFRYLERHIRRVDTRKRKPGGKPEHTLVPQPTTIIEQYCANVAESDMKMMTSSGEDTDPNWEVSDAKTTRRATFKRSNKKKRASSKKYRKTEEESCDTSSEVGELLERGENVQRDPQPRSVSDHTDTTSLAKRHFADVIYYETLAMDEFSWTDFQMQAFQLLMRVKQARMRRSRSHQQSFTTSFNSCALVERGNTPTHP